MRSRFCYYRCSWQTLGDHLCLRSFRLRVGPPRSAPASPNAKIVYSSMQHALKAMEEQGMGWRFGADDPAALFAKHGWDVEIKEPGVEGARYDPRRFPNPPGSSWSFFVVARRT